MSVSRQCSHNFELLSTSAFSLANYRKSTRKVMSPITLNTDTAIVHLPIQNGTAMTKFIRLDSVIIISKAIASPKQLHTAIYLPLCPECRLTIPSANYYKPNKDKLRL